MNAPGSVLTWLCAAVVVLPLSPCAFFSSTYCQHEQQAEAAADQIAQTSERPCCANHGAPARPVQSKGEKPCQGECCKLSPFVKGSEKLIVASPLSAILATVVSLDPAPLREVAVSATAIPQLPLNVLHCQWRC